MMFQLLSLFRRCMPAFFRPAASCARAEQNIFLPGTAKNLPENVLF